MHVVLCQMGTILVTADFIQYFKVNAGVLGKADNRNRLSNLKADFRDWDQMQ